MPSLIAKLAALGWRGWRDLIRAQRALLTSRRRLRQEPLGALAGRDRAELEPPTGEPSRAEAVALAVLRVSAHGLFRPYCLVQAMAIRDLLIDEGFRGATIRIGVRKQDGRFQAHAWVRWGDRILGDRREHIATFAEVDDLRVLPPA